MHGLVELSENETGGALYGYILSFCSLALWSLCKIVVLSNALSALVLNKG